MGPLKKSWWEGNELSATQATWFQHKNLDTSMVSFVKNNLLSFNKQTVHLKKKITAVLALHYTHTWGTKCFNVLTNFKSSGDNIHKPTKIQLIRREMSQRMSGKSPRLWAGGLVAFLHRCAKNYDQVLTANESHGRVYGGAFALSLFLQEQMTTGCMSKNFYAIYWKTEKKKNKNKT